MSRLANQFTSASVSSPGSHYVSAPADPSSGKKWADPMAKAKSKPDPTKVVSESGPGAPCLGLTVQNFSCFEHQGSLGAVVAPRSLARQAVGESLLTSNPGTARIFDHYFAGCDLIVLLAGMSWCQLTRLRSTPQVPTYPTCARCGSKQRRCSPMPPPSLASFSGLAFRHQG